MKIEERLEKFKKVYQETSVSDEQMIQEWQLLENMLGDQQKSYVSPLFFRAFAFAAIVLFLSGGVVTLAQASKPGELLYPVKEVSQNVINEVKKTTPVFSNVTATPTETPQPTVEATHSFTPEKEKKEKDEKHEDRKVKGISDEKPSFESHVQEMRKKHLEKKNSQQGGDKKSENHGSAGQGSSHEGSPQGEGKAQDNSSKNR